MSWTNQYIGIPYKLNGRNREGLDCWGLVRMVYGEQFNVSLPALNQQYEHPTDADGFGDAYELALPEWREVDEPQEFDVYWCRIAGIECHTGIALGNGQMLHAMQGNDSHIVNIRNPAWQRRIQKCYRLA